MILTTPGFILKSTNFCLLFMSGHQDSQENGEGEHDHNFVEQESDWRGVMEIIIQTFEDILYNIVEINCKIR